MATKKRRNIRVFSVDADKVVDAITASGRTDYSYAIEKLVPLVNRLDIQRRIQNPRFYDRLKRDILKGCLMPPITLAFVRKSFEGLNTQLAFEEFLESNIDSAFVLDGIQRLSTLDRAYKDATGEFPFKQPLFFNVLICKSTDNLLYRMITLNNGQRPMTTRHQIEILTSNLFDDSGETVLLVREKDAIKQQQGIFAKADFVLGYIAFLSNSTTVDSQKLIQEKLDELLANKILEHDPTDDKIQFADVMELIGRLCQSEKVDVWFKTPNNLIGFCAGVRVGYDALSLEPPEEFSEFIQNFEEGFKAFNVAKLKLGQARRKAVAYAIRHYRSIAKTSAEEITERLVDVIE